MSTSILIHASKKSVWEHIERVPAIKRSELPASRVYWIGFPQPVEATLSREEVGGVRQASFTRGLLFTETIYEWKPNEELAFSIRANTDSIPPTTLDEHVKIGGPFFDVLDGDYRLEELSDNAVLLHLQSRERLSTHFNSLQRPLVRWHHA